MQLELKWRDWDWRKFYYYEDFQKEDSPVVVNRLTRRKGKSSVRQCPEH